MVWLNDAQFYLDTPDSQGEKVAAALRELLRDDKRGPVLILATLWPEHWSALTVRPGPRDSDPHSQARELLSGWGIPVPEVFTSAELSGLTEASDPRLRRAAALSLDGEVTQFLAGAPELLSRYDNAGPSAGALIDAAMDARRLGMGEAIPLSFLEQAAPAYLTNRQWTALADDWLPVSLTYTGELCKGALGPLTKIRERPGHPAVSREGTYRLADYLDQHARRTRRTVLPPSGFWTAAGKLADPGDLQALGKAAADRGLLRQAARLYKRAATYGETRSAADCLRMMDNICPGEPAPAGQLIENVTGCDGRAVADGLKALRKTGADEQAVVLLARGTANVALDDPDSLRELLSTARDMGARDQIAVLVARDPASHVPLDHMLHVTELLEWLHAYGEREQASALARRAARDASLKAPRDVCHLLEALVSIGAIDDTAVLLARDPASQVGLDHPQDVVELLQGMQEIGADEQVEVLLTRIIGREVNGGNLQSVSVYTRGLFLMGAKDQVLAIARRAETYADPANADTSVLVAGMLAEARAKERAEALLTRCAEEAVLDDPSAVATLLSELRVRGLGEQVSTLLARDPAATVSCDNPWGVADLVFRTAVLDDRFERLAGEGRQLETLLERNPAEQVSLDNLAAVRRLLEALMHAGPSREFLWPSVRARQQFKILARRAVTVENLDSANAQHLLWLLAHAPGVSGIEVLIEILIGRLPAEGMFGVFLQQGDNRVVYRFGREPDGTPAEPWGWADLD